MTVTPWSARQAGEEAHWRSRSAAGKGQSAAPSGRCPRASKQRHQQGWTRAPGLCKLHKGTWAWAQLESCHRMDTATITWGDGRGRSFRKAPIGPQPPVPFKSWIQYLLWIWDLKVHLKFSLLININKGWDWEIADGNSKNVTERFMKYNVRFKMRSFFNFPKGHTHLIHAYAYFGWKYFIFWTPNNQFLCHC